MTQSIGVRAPFRMMIATAAFCSATLATICGAAGQEALAPPKPALQLPEPLPADVSRTEVVAQLPEPRYYFNPPILENHFGLRVAFGGGVQVQSVPSDLFSVIPNPAASIHFDLSGAARLPFKLAYPGLGGYWQKAIWTSMGYSYTYSLADSSARHFFVAGVGIGVHKAAKNGRHKEGHDPNERPMSIGFGWTPNILLGRAAGDFAVGLRNVLSVEVYRHIVGLHLSYDFIYVPQGTIIHDGFLSISFDPFGWT